MRTEAEYAADLAASARATHAAMRKRGLCDRSHNAPESVVGPKIIAALRFIAAGEWVVRNQVMKACGGYPVSAILTRGLAEENARTYPRTIRITEAGRDALEGAG